jgi:hypothetical protein
LPILLMTNQNFLTEALVAPEEEPEEELPDEDPDFPELPEPEEELPEPEELPLLLLLPLKMSLRKPPEERLPEDVVLLPWLELTLIPLGLVLFAGLL